jgi:hypothetical protein
VLSYAATATVPAIDDFGEAQVVSGRGYVAIDPAFANAQTHLSPAGNPFSVKPGSEPNVKK